MASCFKHMRQVQGKYFCEILSDPVIRLSVFGPRPPPAAKHLVKIMEQDGPSFIELTIEIAQTTHKTVSALGFMFGASGFVDASNVIFYCLSVIAARNRRVKALPYTQRSDPFMFAKPDESQQGVTVIIPITGPVPLVTHQGSQQVVI